MRADDMHAPGLERVRRAHHGADIEIVRPVLHGDFEIVASARVQVGFDRRDRPIPVPVEHVTTIAFVEQLRIIQHVGRARFTRMVFFPRAYADLAECGFAGGLRGHIDRVRRVHQRSSASSNSCTNGSS